MHGITYDIVRTLSHVREGCDTAKQNAPESMTKPGGVAEGREGGW